MNLGPPAEWPTAPCEVFSMATCSVACAGYFSLLLSTMHTTAMHEGCSGPVGMVGA